MDYTPGVFDILISSADGSPRQIEESRVRTTLAKQLALYVVLYSPLQMASDLPENYEGQPAFQFIRDVPVDWELSATLAGRIGDFVVVLRKERDGPDWYLAAITDEEPRSFDITLSFLPEGGNFVAEIYADGEGAHWLNNPLPISISSQPVNATSTLTLQLAPGGGQAIRIRPADIGRRSGAAARHAAAGLSPGSTPGPTGAASSARRIASRGVHRSGRPAGSEPKAVRHVPSSASTSNSCGSSEALKATIAR